MSRKLPLLLLLLLLLLLWLLLLLLLLLFVCLFVCCCWSCSPFMCVSPCVVCLFLFLIVHVLQYEFVLLLLLLLLYGSYFVIRTHVVCLFVTLVTIVSSLLFQIGPSSCVFPPGCNAGSMRAWPCTRTPEDVEGRVQIPRKKKNKKQ